MGERPQTSVMVLPAVVESLQQIAAEYGCSRDEALRRVLADHLEQQAAREPGDRISHITTVLGYPPRPPGRNRPSGRVRLGPRLDPGAAEAAAVLGLRLPGQAEKQAHRDYARAPLTDAIVTAVALARPFKVTGLETLPTCLRHDVAIALWRLVFAGTMTLPELRAMWADDIEPGAEDDTVGRVSRDEVKRLVREGDIAWHHPWRREMALHFATIMLGGPDRDKYLKMLVTRDDEFDEIRADLEHRTNNKHWLLVDAPWPSSTVAGRGGAAIWRAKRRLRLADVARWAVAERTPERLERTEPLDWTLALPPGWLPVEVTDDAAMTDAMRAEVDQGRVVDVTFEKRRFLWPYTVDGNPVPMFDVVLKSLGRVPVEEIIELAALDGVVDIVYPLADVAHELGLISAGERDERVSEAKTLTAVRIGLLLARARKRLPMSEVTALEAVQHDPAAFGRLAAEHYMTLYVASPWSPWEVDSLPVEMAKGDARPDRIAWLAGALRGIVQRDLERDMEQAGRASVWIGRTESDDETDETGYIDEELAASLGLV